MRSGVPYAREEVGLNCHGKDSAYYASGVVVVATIGCRTSIRKGWEAVQAKICRRFFTEGERCPCVCTMSHG